MSDEAPLLPQDHWVSRGYQQNFANDRKQVAIIDVAGREVVSQDQPIRRNFCMRGFTTYIDQGGQNGQLEQAFARIEKSVLHQIRSVSEQNRGPRLEAAVANLFAIHLVRNPSFKTLHETIVQEFRENNIPKILTNPKLPRMFEAEFGRPARDGEIRDYTIRRYDVLMNDPETSVSSVVRQHDQIAEKLNEFHMQILTVAPGFPGLSIGDVPIVHAQPRSGRYGFRDRLALLDADLIIGPLSRTVAVCFTARNTPSITLNSYLDLDTINAIFMRAAIKEIACHPEDADHLRDVAGRLDRLPPEAMLG